MLDYNKQRSLIVVCILASILVVIIAIVALAFTWRTKPEEKVEYKVGEVNLKQVSAEMVQTKYYNEISNLLMENKLDEFCQLIGKDYLEYYGYTIEDVKKQIEERKILGKKLDLTNGEIHYISGYTAVYNLELKSSGEMYSIGVIIREVSPENYTIALDKFIDTREDVYKASYNSVELQIPKMTRFINSVEYRFRLTNNYHDEIKINSTKSAHGIVITAADGKYKRPVALTLANKTETIPTGEAREYDATYSIETDTDFLKYNIVVVQGVEYSGVAGVAGLQFNLK